MLVSHYRLWKSSSESGNHELINWITLLVQESCVQKAATLKPIGRALPVSFAGATHPLTYH